MQQPLLKYILIALVVAGLLKYTPGLDMDNEKICTLILIASVLLFVVDMLSKNNEGMDSVSAVVDPNAATGLCNGPIRYPNPYRLNSLDQDEVQSYLRYDNNLPDNPLIQHGQFSGDLRGGYRQFEPNYGSNITMDKYQALICQSKMNDFVQQHNHFRWTPHTQIGKARSYLNWKHFY